MKRIFAALCAVLPFSQVLCNNINWSFPPTSLSSVNQNASDPQVAIDSNGDVFAAWVENGFVKSSTHNLNSSWSSLSTLSNSGASFPRIVSDLNGNVIAVWLEGGIVKTASKPFNGSWSASTSLSLSGASSPEVAVASTGDAVAVWSRSGNVESSTKLFGANWQNRVTISSTAAAFPRVAIGGTGANVRAAIVWQGTSSSTNVVYSSTKLLSGSWTSQQVISDLNHQATNARVAVDANSNATAVWYQYDLTGSNYSDVVVQTATRPSSGSWSAPLSLSSAGIHNPATLVARVAFDSTGNAIALWNNSSDDETFSIESAVCPARGNWTSAQDIVSSNLFAFAEDAAVTSFGDVLATYMFYNGSSLLIQSVESDIDAATTTPWSVPINFSAGMDNGYPRIAASLSGNVINAAVLWVTYNGTNTSVVASIGARTLVLPPSNLSVTQNVTNFGVFNDYYNTLNWQASSDPGVAGYLVFRNGVFLEQVAANVLQFVDHNRTQGGSVTYGVAAVNDQLSQSRTVTVNFP